jgi:hypothetical protein
MKTGSTSQAPTSFAIRSLAVLTAGAFLFTALGAAPAEASFWEDRAAARARQNVPSSMGGNVQGKTVPQTLLAQLPVSQPLSFGGAVVSALPAFSPRVSSFSERSPLWAKAAVTPFADVRSVREGVNKAVRVFLVMDAHDVYSAQRNVARLLARLGIQGKWWWALKGRPGRLIWSGTAGCCRGWGNPI